MSAPVRVDTVYRLGTASARGVRPAQTLPVPPSESALAVSEFSKTYRMVRGGAEQEVTVDDFDALVRLRTELAILERFGRGANDDVVAALEASAGSADGAADDDLAETLQILRDATSPVIAETVGLIDAEFPQSADSAQLQSISQDAAAFHKGVAERIAASPDANAEELARAYLSVANPEPDQPSATVVTRDGDDAMSESTDVQAAAAAVDEPTAETQSADGEGTTVAADVPEQAEAVLAEAQAVASGADVPAPAPEPDPNPMDDTDSVEAVDDVDQILDSIAADVEAAETEAATPADPPVDETSTEDESEAAPEAADDAVAPEAPVEQIAEDAAPPDDEQTQTEGHADPADDGIDDVLDAIDEIVDEVAVAEELVAAEKPAVTDETNLASVDVPTDVSRTADVRAQLDEIRDVLTAQTDRLVAVLDQVESMETEARKTLAHADRLRAAAEAAQLESTAALDAQETYAQAQQEADQARLSAQQAQAKADAARQALDGLLTDEDDA